MKRVLGLGALALGLVPGSARADGETLRQAADRVAAEWRSAGAIVERLPARFLFDGQSATVRVEPPQATLQTCATVALLGARGVSFHAKVAGVEDDPLNDDPTTRASSVAGVLEMAACGAQAQALERLRVTFDAGRGAVETVFARSAAPLPSLKTVLPERTGGVLPPSPDAGPAPVLPPAIKRAETAEARAKGDGAALAPRFTWTARSDGSGDSRLELQAGCHRIEVFAPDARGAHATHRRRLDVDAEIRDGEDEPIARDRTDNADARVEACVGEATASTVIFAGAPPSSEVVVTHGWWPIPEHLPALWGPQARARMARALLARRAHPPPEDAVALFVGPWGATPVVTSVEPGACYLAVAAVTQGHSRGLGLRVVVGGRDARAERTLEDDAGAVAFCAGDEARARFEVEARPIGVAWGLALFRVEGRVWGGR